MQTESQTTPVGRGLSEPPSGLGLSGAGCIKGANRRVRIDIHKKAFIRADSWQPEILAKFHIHVKD